VSGYSQYCGLSFHPWELYCNDTIIIYNKQVFLRLLVNFNTTSLYLFVLSYYDAIMLGNAAREWIMG